MLSIYGLILAGLGAGLVRLAVHKKDMPLFMILVGLFGILLGFVGLILCLVPFARLCEPLFRGLSGLSP